MDLNSIFAHDFSIASRTRNTSGYGYVLVWEWKLQRGFRFQ
jgi:hypothetical protein